MRSYSARLYADFLPRLPRSPPPAPWEERACTCVPVAMHTMQRVHRVTSERARAFLTPRVGELAAGDLAAER